MRFPRFAALGAFVIMAASVATVTPASAAVQYFTSFSCPQPPAAGPCSQGDQTGKVSVVSSVAGSTQTVCVTPNSGLRLSGTLFQLSEGTATTVPGPTNQACKSQDTSSGVFISGGNTQSEAIPVTTTTGPQATIPGPGTGTPSPVVTTTLAVDAPVANQPSTTEPRVHGAEAEKILAAKAAKTANPTPTNSLAYTGDPTVTRAELAALLLVIGFGLVYLSRKPRFER